MTISSQTRTAGPFAGNDSTTEFPFTFKVFQTSDLRVVQADADGVETDLVLNTDYTATLNANQDSNPGGTVTLATALPTGEVLVVTSEITYTQGVNITNQGGFYPAVINGALDRLTILTQQLKEEVDRSAKLPITNEADAASLVSDIVLLADMSTDLETLAGISANVTTVAGISANVTTVAGISANVTTVAGIDTEVTTVAGIAASVSAVAAVNTEVTTVAGIAANVTAVAAVDTEVTTVAGIAANVTTVAGIAANVTAVAAVDTEVTTVAGIAANVTAVAAIDTDVTTAAANVADITNFADVYLGPAASDPTTRTDLSALVAGDLYFNTTIGRMKVYTGAAWSETPNGSMSVQTFSGDDVETAFTLAAAPASENNTQVFIGGVYQQKSEYSISGTTLTFSTAPVTGTDNIEVVTVSTFPMGSTSSDLVTHTPTSGSQTTVQDELREREPADDVAALRALTGVSGQVTYLKAHTTAGDSGFGGFRWVSGAAAGTYVDNNGTVIVPTGGDGSAAWLREYSVVDVLMFGADKTGVAESYAAFAAALAVASFVYVPPGTYKIGTTITITGDRTITGPDGGTQAQQTAVINFTGAGNPFSAVSAEFGGVCIKNLKITGGDGSYAIRSSRPQSLFENITIEGDYTGGGIELFEAGTGSQASWGCTIRNCKWVGPATPSAYRGYQIDINGGHVTIENCTAIYGAIGLNIDQGEAINIIRCSFNQQTSTYSSEAATDTAGIRLSGAGYKKAISIRNCYIESFTHGLYVEKCESLSIEDNYIADVGNNSNYASIYLKDSNVKSVTIRNNNISDQGSSSASIEIGDGARDVLVSNNIIVSTGTASSCITKSGITPAYIFRNNLTSGGAGYVFIDADYGLVNLDFNSDGFSSGKRRDFTASPNTWYDIATVANNQIWHLSIVDGNSPGTWSREDMLYIDSSGTAVFKTIDNTNPGYSTREWQVSAGVLQFRVVAGSNTLNNVAAQLMV